MTAKARDTTPRSIAWRPEHLIMLRECSAWLGIPGANVVKFALKQLHDRLRVGRVSELPSETAKEEVR